MVSVTVRLPASTPLNRRMARSPSRTPVCAERLRPGEAEEIALQPQRALEHRVVVELRIGVEPPHHVHLEQPLVLVAEQVFDAALAEAGLEILHVDDQLGRRR